MTIGSDCEAIYAQGIVKNTEAISCQIVEANN